MAKGKDSTGYRRVASASRGGASARVASMSGGEQRAYYRQRIEGKVSRYLASQGFSADEVDRFVNGRAGYRLSPSRVGQAVDTLDRATGRPAIVSQGLSTLRQSSSSRLSASEHQLLRDFDTLLSGALR